MFQPLETDFDRLRQYLILVIYIWYSRTIIEKVVIISFLVDSIYIVLTNKLISDETIFRDFACFGIRITNSRQEIIIKHFKVFIALVQLLLYLWHFSRARRSQAVCADDCVDECYIECQENHLELIYDFDASRHRSVREYFNNRSAFDKK